METSRGYLFEHPKTVQHFHTGPDGRATVSALCRFAQESAGCHAELLGFGGMRLGRLGIAWVLREQTMLVLEQPSLGQSLRVCTWPTGSERVLCHRDYRILDGEGRVMALGTSSWFGLDLGTRRPRRADSFFSLPMEMLPPPVFENPLPELDAPEERAASETRTVRASDIDALGHMNNLRYVDWVADHLARFGRLESSPRCVRIRYAREVAAGDRVVVRHDLDANGDVRVAMYGEEHGREVCVARLVLNGTGPDGPRG